MSQSRVIGAILLIVGTSIGGGMLALPVATAEVGFGNSIFYLMLCWMIMTAGALLVLEVNMRLPAGSNMISMAKSTLGLPGQIIAWLTYLFLLYTLLAAYISGGSDVLNGILHNIHINLPETATALVFTCLFSFIVYKGIQSVDYVNRGLMFFKLGVYVLLVLIISPHIEIHRLGGGTASAISGTLMILITSFGFASIVPSLRDYLQSDLPTLRRVIVLGSLVPLVCYLLWDAAIMGSIQADGDLGLKALANSNHATSGLSTSLSQAVHSNWISGFFGMFTSVCMVTAFLGVSLGLFDFLADGLKLKKQGNQGRLALALTFLPPLIVVLLSPGIYLSALSYAGICCVVLLLLLPAIMAWRGRTLDMDQANPLLPGGRLSLAVLILAACLILYIAL